MIKHSEIVAYATALMEYCKGDYHLAQIQITHELDKHPPSRLAHKIALAARKHLTDEQRRKREAEEFKRKHREDEIHAKRLDLAFRLLKSAGYTSLADTLEECITGYPHDDFHLVIARAAYKALDIESAAAANENDIPSMNNLARASEFFYTIANPHI